MDYNLQRQHGALSHRPPLARLHEFNGNTAQVLHLDLYRTGQLDLDALITKTYSLGAEPQIPFGATQ